MLAEITQTNANSLGLALVGIAVPVLYWWSRARADKLAATAKEKTNTIDSLEEELKRKDAALVLAETRLVNAWKTLEDHAQARIALIEQTGSKIAAEEERQRELRHDLKAEVRSQSTRIHDLEEENKALRNRLDEALARISALENKNEAV